jgi:prepilin-type N-terminal cleavage/methylation domain-containing protein
VKRRTTLAPRSRGFTLLEVLVSTAVLSVVALAAVTTTRAATTATGTVVKIDGADGATDDAFDLLRSRFVSASLGTLKGIPVSGKVYETMLPNTVYADVQFRAVTGLSKGARVFTPPMNLAAWHLYRTVDAKGRGSLMFDAGSGGVPLLGDVRSLTFQLTGKRLVMTVVVGRPDKTGSATHEVDFTLIVA